MNKPTNTGDRSTGDLSTGHRSTGDLSTGHRSTGHWSTGDLSTGHRSTGHWSTGDLSTGYLSTGYRSTGDGSTGDWSTSNYSTGHFSTIDDSGFGAFNKPCSRKTWNDAIKPDFIYRISPTEWVHSEYMTDQEKVDNPSHETTGGYLKTRSYKEAWAKAWDGRKEGDIELLLALPNFDAEVFKEISGIDVNECIGESKLRADLAELKAKVEVEEMELEIEREKA